MFLIKRALLALTLSAALALGGAGMASADEGGAPPDGPQAVADAPPPEMGVSDYVNDDEFLPKEPTSDAMTALVSAVTSMLGECRPGATLVSIQPVINEIDPGSSTLLVVTRGDADRVMDEPLADLLASCSSAGKEYTASIMTNEADLLALL